MHTAKQLFTERKGELLWQSVILSISSAELKLDLHTDVLGLQELVNTIEATLATET